jgi:hypothetical protein
MHESWRRCEASRKDSDQANVACINGPAPMMLINRFMRYASSCKLIALAIRVHVGPADDTSWPREARSGM